ncbi:MAG: SRPBCC family protein, partial [Myxococcales bacterium]|nr:SRPBCC family protein [Myxococcales bacterium]
MQVTTQASVHIPKAPKDVFAFATTPTTLAKCFRGSGPVPGIMKVEIAGGGPLKIGATREVRMSDNSVLQEEIRAHEPGVRHSYRIVGGLKAPLRWLVRWGEGDWSFRETGKGTEFTWHYTFELTSPLARPLASVVVGRFMNAAMRDFLDRVRHEMMAAAVVKDADGV